MMNLATEGRISHNPELGRAVPLRVNFAWTSIGNAVYAACQWAMVSVLAKLGSAELVGQYALGIAATVPVLMLAQLNLRSVLVTDPDFAGRFRDYRNLRLTMMAISSIAILAIALPMNGGMTGIVLLAGAMQAVEWVSDIYLGLFQRLERMERIAISLAARGVISVAALGFGVWATGRLTVGLGCVFAVRLLVLLVYDCGIAFKDCRFQHEGPPPQASQARRLWSILVTALPLGVVLMVGSLGTNTPRYFAAHHLGDHALGIFSAVASLATGGGFVVNALGQAATPALARFYASDDRVGFRRLTNKLAAMGAALGAAAVAGSLVAGGFVLRTVYRPEYAEYTGLLAAMMFVTGIGFMGSLLGYAMTAARMFREQVPLQLASLCAAAATSFFAVPRFGLMGAAAGVGAGSLAQLVGEAVLLTRWLQRKGRL